MIVEVEATKTVDKAIGVIAPLDLVALSQKSDVAAMLHVIKSVGVVIHAMQTHGLVP